MPDTAKPGDSDGPFLSGTGLSKRFGALTVLDSVDFAVGRDAAIGIVGPNGAGKTTLLNLLAGALSPSEGRIDIHGRDVTRMDSAARCRIGIARTHQVPRPFSGMTVFENVYVAAAYSGESDRSALYDRCAGALETCGLLNIANRRAETLGLLHRKRLELARALATKPQVLLLDEIAGGLTDSEAIELLETIRSLHAGGIAIVWIEHIVHILVQAIDHLVCLDGGRMIASGKPDDVMADDVVIEAYLGSGVR